MISSLLSNVKRCPGQTTEIDKAYHGFHAQDTVPDKLVFVTVLILWLGPSVASQIVHPILICCTQHPDCFQNLYKHIMTELKQSFKLRLKTKDIDKPQRIMYYINKVLCIIK